MRLVFLYWLVALSAYAQNPICIGERYELPSTVMSETRSIDVYLPPSYTDASLKPASYPVIYLLDAESNFRYFSTMVEKLTQGVPSMPECIVIGIENTDRERDLTPEGNGRFWQFVADELRPWVEKQYRCADFRIVVGHSLSGLAAVNALLTHPTLFNVYVAHDPSLWWNDNYAIELFKQRKGDDFQHRLLYISHSGYKVRHNGRSRHIETLNKLQAMTAKGDFKNLNSLFVEYPDENHGTVQVVGNLDLLRQVFAEMFIDRNDIEENPQIIKQRYEALSRKLHYRFTPSESYLKNTARWLRKNGKEAQAKAVLNIEF